LDHILVVQFMLLTHFLGVEFDRGTPHHGVPELSDHGSVDSVTKILYRALRARDNDGSVVVGVLSFGFCVDSDQVEILPYTVH